MIVSPIIQIYLSVSLLLLSCSKSDGRIKKCSSQKQPDFLWHNEVEEGNGDAQLAIHFKQRFSVWYQISVPLDPWTETDTWTVTSVKRGVQSMEHKADKQMSTLLVHRMTLDHCTARRCKYERRTSFRFLQTIAFYSFEKTRKSVHEKYLLYRTCCQSFHLFQVKRWDRGCFEWIKTLS